MVPSLDKDRHGFDGQKWAHTASSPLTIRQVFSAGLSLSGRISAPAKLPAPDRDGFSSDFCFLRRRWAGAHQGEKSKKRRKGALSGVFALVERWYARQYKTRFSHYARTRFIQHPHRCKKAIQNSTTAKKTKPAKP